MLKKPDAILTEGLIEKGLLTRHALDVILGEVDLSSQTLGSCLIKRGIVSEKEALTILAQGLGCSYLSLKEITIDKSLVDKVTVAIASYYKFMPVKLEGRLLTIAVSWPLDIKSLDAIRTHLGFAYDIEVALACSGDILDMLRSYYGLAAEILDKIISQSSFSKSPEAQQAEQDSQIEDIDKLAQDASVVNLVNQIILEAYRKRATDIHIEPFRGGVSLRYRIDGVLYDADAPEQIKYFLLPIISRIKIMSNLNIVERRLPQDGRGVVKIQDQVLDLRISTIPTPYGESLVIRILPGQMLFSLEKLGLVEKEVKLLEGLIERPYGIIFVTGPTGSGKTTTLYACLSKINTRQRKIITIEDPIEYEVGGITQIQVAPDIGMDFARGLRSMLRHDPDVMMVGEVRDLETAEIAIRVALTGHLVFSSLHTNDAASGITRLVDIGIEPYLVASSVEAFIAQRLVRVICPRCRYEDQTPFIDLKRQIAVGVGMASPKDVKIFRGKGCQECNYSGFFGRTAIYEMLLIDDVMKDLISRRLPSGEIKKVAMKHGMITLRQYGWQKVVSGVTTPEEVMKVTPAEEYELKEKAKGVNIPMDLSAAGQEVKTGGELSDQRVYMRLGSKINLRYKIFESQADLTNQGYNLEQLSQTTNLSAGGLLFVSDKQLVLSSFLELIIELPDNQPAIKCLAKVLRVQENAGGQGYDIGVCFLDLTGLDRSRMNKYVEADRKDSVERIA